MDRRPVSERTGRLFLVGIVLFSGSLYALALTGVRALGGITPLGRPALIAGWVCLGAGCLGGGPGRDK